MEKSEKLYDWVTKCCIALRSSSSKEELRSHLSSHLQSEGFNGFTFIEMRPSRIDFIVHDCTYSYNWPQRYYNKDYGKIDPVVKRMITENSAFHWSGPEYRKKSKEKNIVDFFEDAENHGITQGISVPMHKQGELHMFTVVTASSKKIIDDALITAVRLIAENYNMSFLAIEHHRNNTSAPMCTHREQQALLLSALGATGGDTAKILGISPKTVERQLQTAREKIWARSQTAATAFAINAGIVRLNRADFSEFTWPLKFSIKHELSPGKPVAKQGE